MYDMANSSYIMVRVYATVCWGNQTPQKSEVNFRHTNTYEVQPPPNLQ